MRFSLLSQLAAVPVVVVDVETTGASADLGDRIIEVGAVRWENGREIARYQQLIDPQQRIGRGITYLTGISQEMVAGQPSFAQAAAELLQIMQGAAVVGHNVRFDLSFLLREFRRAGMDLCERLGDVPVFDTVRIARRRFGRGGNALQRLAPRLGITPDCAHRALADADTTAQVLDRLLEPVGGWQICLADAIGHQGGPMRLMPPAGRAPLLPLELEEALDQRRPVLMEYIDARDCRTQRMVTPLRIRRRAGELMLLAHCALRDEQRTFKVDRIVRFLEGESLFSEPPQCAEQQLGVEE